MNQLRFAWRGGIAALLIVLSGCVGTRPDGPTNGVSCSVVVERDDDLAHYRVPVWIDDGDPVDVPLRGTATLSAAPGSHRLSMRPVNTTGVGWWTPAHIVVDLAFSASAGGVPQFFSTDLDFSCVDGETRRFIASPSIWGKTTLVESNDEESASP